MDQRDRRGKQCRRWLKHPNPIQPRSSRHRHDNAQVRREPEHQVLDVPVAAEVNMVLQDDNPAVNEHAADVDPSLEDYHDDDDQQDREDTQDSHEDEQVDNVQDESNRLKETDLNNPIFPGLKKTKFEVLLMSFYLMMRHGLSSVALLDHFKFLNNLFDEEVLPSGTLKYFNRIFKSAFRIEVHFYCSDCQTYLGKVEKDEVSSVQNNIECKVCHRICVVKKMNDGNFFLYIPMIQQLKYFLENTPNVENLLEYKEKREKNPDDICDIFDGDVYKSLAKDGGVLSNKDSLVLSVATDGSPVFGSAHNSMWGIQFIINNLPPHERFKKENTLVCGVWFGKKEPEMSAYFTPFVREARAMCEDGFEWCNRKNELILTKAVILNFNVDSLARPKVLCCKRFNGRFGCSFCYHPSFIIPGHRQSRYIMDNNVQYQLTHECTYTVSEYDKRTQALIKVHQVKDRTNAQVRRDMEAIEKFNDGSVSDKSTEEEPEMDDEIHDGENASGSMSDEMSEDTMSDRNETLDVDSASDNENETVESRDECKSIRGVKEKSLIYFLYWIDLAFGFPVDYLHCVLLGVLRTLGCLWFDSKFSDESFSLRAQMDEIDRRLKSMKPPTTISRRPRSIKEKALWKGNEWRSFLLYYSLPCFSGIMKPEYFRHHCLLVTAIYILLQEKITLEELHRAGWYLTLYVTEYQKLYGAVRMNFNVHLLLHLSKCTKFYGPLWAFSTFFSESGQGFLVSLVKGTVSVASQIAEKYCKFQSLQNIVSQYNISEETVEFCNYLVPHKFVKSVDKIGSVTLLGLPKFRPYSSREKLFVQAGNLIPLIAYDRMIINRIKYHAACYSRQGRSSYDSAIKLSDNTYAILERIFLNESDGCACAVVCQINLDMMGRFVSHRSGARASHIKKCSSYVTYGDLSIIKVEKIVQKVVFMSLSNSDVYLSEIPNNFERD